MHWVSDLYLRVPLPQRCDKIFRTDASLEHPGPGQKSKSQFPEARRKPSKATQTHAIQILPRMAPLRGLPSGRALAIAVLAIHMPSDKLSVAKIRS